MAATWEKGRNSGDEVSDRGQGQIMPDSYAMLRNLDLDLVLRMAVRPWRIHWEGGGGIRKMSSNRELPGILCQ